MNKSLKEWFQIRKKNDLERPILKQDLNPIKKLKECFEEGCRQTGDPPKYDQSKALLQGRVV